MAKLDIAGLKIDLFSKQELLNLISRRITLNQQTWVITPYSEFLHAGLQNPQVMETLNKADVAVADGIGIFWAHRFLSLPFFFKNFWLRIFEAYWQAFLTLIILPFRKYPTIPGSDLIWDIAKFAAENNLLIYLLGGFGNTPKLVSEKLSQKITSTKISGRLFLLIAGYSNKNPDDPSIIEDINRTNPDIVLVAFGPIKQEQWIFENLPKLKSVKLAMGVGGAFDYIAGKRLAPPTIIRKVGLEWLWRLFTQPNRLKRIWNATFGLITMLVRYKVFSSLPLRQNVVVMILNKNNQVLICQRDPQNHHVDIIHNRESLSAQNYWQFPQGGTDKKEDLAEAAKREALEETGLADLQLIMTSPQTNTYIWNNALRKFWKNRFHQNRGQKQNIVYCKHNGDETNVKIDNNEFINYRWVNIEDLEKTIHPERLALAKIVQQDLKEMAKKGII